MERQLCVEIDLCGLLEGYAILDYPKNKVAQTSVTFEGCQCKLKSRKRSRPNPKKENSSPKPRNKGKKPAQKKNLPITTLPSTSGIIFDDCEREYDEDADEVCCVYRQRQP
ncbi:hypothetical protein DPMN_099580 [Dreissena polymorpha]|uniref:Uncharacterized protein n=1 Tax=Dreissena polymorpha TaxID=45954 RepID=A0A9D4LFV8_DREPO|nr:hypothetical protein DPMN_099580 [Dreissena polymorpha]